MYSSFVSHLVGIRTVSIPSGTPRKFMFKRIFQCKPFILLWKPSYTSVPTSGSEYYAPGSMLPPFSCCLSCSCAF